MKKYGFIISQILAVPYYIYSAENSPPNGSFDFVALLPLLTMAGLIAFIVWIVKKVSKAAETKRTVLYKENKYIKFIGKNYKDILQENDLEEYISIFTENKLTDVIIISELIESDLEKIGVTSLGDRKKILKIFSTE